MRISDGIKRAAMTWRGGKRVRGFRPRPEKGIVRPEANPWWRGGLGIKFIYSRTNRKKMFAILILVVYLPLFQD